MSDEEVFQSLPPKGPGNPTPYRKEFAPRARAMCRMGATDFDLASEFEVTRQTIQNWRMANPEFAQATKVGKAMADERVKRSLFERAVGYSYESEKIMTRSIGDGMNEIVRVPITEHVLPSETAQIWWTRNRLGWRDKQPDEAQADATVRVVIEGGLPADPPVEPETPK